MIRNFCIDVMITTALFGIVWGSLPALSAPTTERCKSCTDSANRCTTIALPNGEQGCSEVSPAVFGDWCGVKGKWTRKGIVLENCVCANTKLAAGGDVVGVKCSCCVE